jgi:hypothetical protein
MTYSNDAWLAGFIDGEGCFSRYTSKRGAPYRPKFSIGLRQDDLPILLALRAEFGGSINDGCTNWERNLQQMRWQISAAADLKRLVAYLDRFPLRAKKADQFSEWRKQFDL